MTPLVSYGGVCAGDSPKLYRNKLITLIVTLLYYPLVPTLLLIFLPIYLFRFIASIASKIARPDLAKLINTRSAVLAVDGFPTSPSWNVVVWLTQEGILDLDKFRLNFLTDHVMKKTSQNGALIYPEYQQHLQKWWGFYFWRWDPSFDIRNHIRPYDGQFSNEPIVDDEILVQIIKELTWKGWDSQKSPWEFLQIKNYKCKTDGNENDTPKSILIFRIHHIIGDGNYILKLLMGDLCGVNLATVAKPKYLKRNILQKFMDIVCFWYRAPYHLCKMYLDAYDVNPWHISHEKFIRPMNAALTAPISLELIKEIKNVQKVCFSSVLHAAIAGGIRNMMIQQGGVCPIDMHLGIPVPQPRHPQGLRNHFICSFITLPVGTDGPLQRLKRSEFIFQEWKFSSAAMLNFIKLPLIGGLLPSMMGPFTFNRLSTCLMSNFPGTPIFPNFQGIKVLDMMFGTGFGPGNNGIGFTLCSCKGNIRLLSAVDRNILDSDAKVAELNAKIVEELHILHKLSLKTCND